MFFNTCDIYLGAFLVVNGCSLDDIRLDEGHRGKPNVSFIFSGSKVDACSKDFQSGQAMVNVASFKVALIHLKDMMFQAIRENEKERRYHGNFREHHG